MMIFLPIIIPLIGALVIFLLPKEKNMVRGIVAASATLLNLLTTFAMFNREMTFSAGWAGFGLDIAMRNYQFSSFILAAAASFALLISIYAASFTYNKDNSKLFFVYMLITLGFVNGAVLSDNLVLMLFFWEGLLATLFGLIYIGGGRAFETAIKAFIISGVADLTMMFGIILTGSLAGTLNMSQIHLTAGAGASVAFTCLMIGAIAKAGSMPFHSWIPDAALDAPLPFMAFLPGAMEKLLGIYFLTRISLDLFVIPVNSWLSYMMMIIGSLTIIFAVLMALIQKDYKKLLSYHAISQVGYMVLGIGTAVPAGIVGGIFHMINNAMYKSCLFLTGGSVEKQAGTTDLNRLGGLGRMMPVTFACFVVAAVSISGVPPFNGFFSKELVYDGALERGWIFYAAALLGSFFTAASFLKLGHSAFLGKEGEKSRGVKEAEWPILLPMIIIASLCVVFGLFNYLPINNLIQPVLGARIEGHSFAGWPANPMLVIGTVIVLLLALAIHWFNAAKKGSGIKAADYIHYAPGFHQVYDAAEKKLLDPYDVGLKLISFISNIAWAVDRGVDWIYGGLSAGAAYVISFKIRAVHNGNYSLYLVWSLAGIFCIVTYMLCVH